jgi:outer membrane lipoprotein-sorting protein
MKLIIFLLVLVLILSFSAYPEDAKDLSAKEMIKISEDIMQGEKSNIMRLRMQVEAPRWQREYEMDVWMKARNRTLIRISSPVRKKGESYLKRDTQLWLYMPQVERTILIPPSSMLQPFLGGDFSYDDLVKVSRLSEDYNCQLLQEEIIAGESSYLINLDPKPEAPVVYGRLKIWLRKTDFVPLKQEFYDEHNLLLKTIDFLDIKPLGGHIIPAIWKMTNNLKPAYQTIIKVEEAQYDSKIADEVFDKERLK